MAKSFEIAYQRLTTFLKRRARMLQQMRSYALRAAKLHKAGKMRQARALLGKAESLQKKLWPSSRRR